MRVIGCVGLAVSLALVSTSETGAADDQGEQSPCVVLETYPALRMVQTGNTPAEVLRLLSNEAVDYMAFDNQDQLIQGGPDALDQRLNGGTLIIRVRVPGLSKSTVSRPVTADDLLSISFSPAARVVKVECKRIFTGP